MNLQYFHSDGAGFSGELPTCICDMTFVQYFYASNNSITGAIPACVGSMTYLREMHLQCNLLNGPVPTGFDTLQFLVELYLECNADLDCTSALSTRSNFIYKCGVDGYDCDDCSITPSTCPQCVTVANCGQYCRQD